MIFVVCCVVIFRVQAFVILAMKDNSDFSFLNSSGKRPIQSGQLFGWRICNGSEVGGWCCFSSEK